MTIEQSKTWRFANLFQFKVNVFSPLNEYFWLGFIGVCRLRYTCRSSSFFFQMEHTGRMNGIIYILLCRNWYSPIISLCRFEVLWQCSLILSECLV